MAGAEGRDGTAPSAPSEVIGKQLFLLRALVGLHFDFLRGHRVHDRDLVADFEVAGDFRTRIAVDFEALLAFRDNDHAVSDFQDRAGDLITFRPGEDSAAQGKRPRGNETEQYVWFHGLLNVGGQGKFKLFRWRGARRGERLFFG